MTRLRRGGRQAWNIVGFASLVILLLRLLWSINNPPQDAHIQRYLEHIKHPTNTFALKVYPKN